MRETNRRFTQRRVVATLGALTLGLIGVGGAVSPATAADTPVFGDINQSTIGSIVVHKGVQQGGAAQGTPSGTAPSGFQGLAGVQFTAYRITSVNPTLEAGWATLHGWATTPPASIVDGTACNALPPTVTGASVSTTGTTSGTTTAAGDATIAGLTVGAYVVCETLSPSRVVDKAQPFIVSVPYPDTTTGGWLYNPSVFPKNGIATITKSVTAQPATSHGLGSAASFPVTTTVPSIASNTQFTHFWIQDPLHPSLTGGTATVAGSGLTSSMYTVEPASSANGNTVTVAFTNLGLQWLKTHAGATITTTFTGTVSAVGDIKNKAYLDSATAVLGTAPTPTPPDTAPGNNNPGNPDNPANPTKANSPSTPSNDVTTSWAALTIHKVDSSSPATGLTGAVFEVYDAATPYPATASACATATSGVALLVGPSSTFSSAAGVVSIPGLFVSDSVNNPGAGNGFRCYVLKEIAAPLGFVTPTGTNAFTAVAVTTAPPVGGFNATVPNTQIRGVVLPMTGSNGIVALTIAGLALISAGLVLAFLARRRKQTV